MDSVLRFIRCHQTLSAAKKDYVSFFSFVLGVFAGGLIVALLALCSVMRFDPVDIDNSF